MSFDYKLRDGVITHSNALELMRMIGLDVRRKCVMWYLRLGA